MLGEEIENSFAMDTDGVCIVSDGTVGGFVGRD